MLDLSHQQPCIQVHWNSISLVQRTRQISKKKHDWSDTSGLILNHSRPTCCCTAIKQATHTPGQHRSHRFNGFCMSSSLEPWCWAPSLKILDTFHKSNCSSRLSPDFQDSMHSLGSISLDNVWSREEWQTGFFSLLSANNQDEPVWVQSAKQVLVYIRSLLEPSPDCSSVEFECALSRVSYRAIIEKPKNNPSAFAKSATSMVDV